MLRRADISVERRVAAIDQKLEVAQLAGTEIQ
jgi:hypothetical protein